MMPAAAVAADRPAAPPTLAASALVAGAMLGLSALRADVLHAGVPNVPVGIAFAAALVVPALALPSVRRRLRPALNPRALGLGGAVGLSLLLPGAWLRLAGLHAAGEVLPMALFAVWGPAVCLVAAGEEVALRAVIQPGVRERLGPGPAIVLTGAVFALMHYPLYGGGALLLDLGVGILIGCLREATRSVAACGVAHALADLGAWWLP